MLRGVFRITFERWRRSAPTTDTHRPTTNKAYDDFTRFTTTKGGAECGEPDAANRFLSGPRQAKPERPKGAKRERFVRWSIFPAFQPPTILLLFSLLIIVFLKYNYLPQLCIIFFFHFDDISIAIISRHHWIFHIFLLHSINQAAVICLKNISPNVQRWRRLTTIWQ